MSLPRDVSAKKLIKALQKFGYSTSRQVGSHIRLETQKNGIHRITIPNHNPIKIGTLSAILTDVSRHLGLNKQELIKKLFG